MQAVQDQLKFAGDPEIKEHLDADGQFFCSWFLERVILSNKVFKYNPMGWKQERSIAVTNKSIINFKKKCMNLRA